MKKRNLNKLSGIISVNSHVRNGQPCFKNTRIPVSYVLRHLTRGWNIDEVSELFPDIKKSHIIKTADYFLVEGVDSFDDQANNSWLSQA